MKILLSTLTLSALLLTGCGTLTGIPSHGGGHTAAANALPSNKNSSPPRPVPPSKKWICLP